MKIIILTTNTLHHKFLIKSLNEISGIEVVVIFVHNKNKKNKYFSKFQKNEYKFEMRKFFNNKSYKIKNKIYYEENVNSKKVVDLIKKQKPDLGILFGTKKVSVKVINAFKKKLINVHRGIMQKYRGLDSEFWAIFNDDYKIIGTTIHFVNSHLDKGKIIFEEKLKLKRNMKCYQLRFYTTLIAIKNIKKVISYFPIKNLKTLKKQKVGKYYSKIPYKIKVEACKKFNKYCKNI